MLCLITSRTTNYVPIAQYLLYPFEGGDWLNSKSKQLSDKSIPDTIVSLKIAKKNVDTKEFKDRVVKEVIEELSIYFSG
jgi:hypothetical protein